MSKKLSKAQTHALGLVIHHMDNGYECYSSVTAKRDKVQISTLKSLVPDYLIAHAPYCWRATRDGIAAYAAAAGKPADDTPPASDDLTDEEAARMRDYGLPLPKITSDRLFNYLDTLRQQLAAMTALAEAFARWLATSDQN